MQKSVEEQLREFSHLVQLIFWKIGKGRESREQSYMNGNAVA